MGLSGCRFMSELLTVSEQTGLWEVTQALSNRRRLR
jgi:hypothetical protein